MDFYPTILEVKAFPETKSTSHGRSSPLLKGLDSPSRQDLFWHYPHYSNQGFPGGAIRRETGVVERYEDGKVHLYNLSRTSRKP